MRSIGISGIFLIGFAALLFVFPSAGALSNEGPYFINMGNISQRIYQEKANVLFLGDSINSNSNTPRMFYGYINKWLPTNWRGLILQGASGVSDQGSVVGNEPSSAQADSWTLEAGSIMNSTRTNISQWNLQKTKFYSIKTDLATGTTIYSSKITNFPNWSNDWTNNSNLTIRFLYLSSVNGTQLRVRNVWRNGTTSPGLTISYLNQTTQGVNYIEHNYSNYNVTGTSATGAILTTTNANETAINQTEFYILGTRIFRNDISTGLQIGYAGGGGFTTLSHSRYGDVLTLDGVSTNTSYSDEALRKWMEYNDLNTFIIWLGQNSAGDEWNGALTRNYTQNINHILRRYSEEYTEAAYSNDTPYFVLVSTYDTSSDNVRHVAQEADLVNITVNNTIAGIQVGMIKLRNYINDTNGTYTNWNNTYTSDGIHPTLAGAEYFAQVLWDNIFLALSNPNGSLSGIDWAADSNSVFNYSSGNSGILLNNTGLLNSSIRVYNLTNALLYVNNYSVVGNLQISNNDLNINFTLSPGKSITILNEFNLTEGVARNNSPIWFSTSTSSAKKIASNLTETINASVSFSVDSCSTLESISYISHSGNYTKTYLSSEYSCSDLTVTLNVTGLEPASGSNNFSISYSTSDSSTGSATSSGKSSPIFSLTSDDLMDGYKSTFYKGGGAKFSINNESHSLLLEDIKNDSVIVTVSSEPITEEIFLGNVGKFDLDANGFYDLQVEVNEIAASKLSAVLTIKSIYEKIPADKPSEGFFDIPVEPEKLPSFVLSVLAVVLLIIFFAILWLLKSRQKKTKR